MRPTGQVIGLLGVMALIALGCSTPLVFPENEGIAVHTSAEFGTLFAQPDTYRDQTVRMAGRMVRVMDTSKGTFIFAEWLPLPATYEEGPVETERGHRLRFTLFYPGTIDSEGLVFGNKFLVLGTIEPSSPNLLPVGLPRDRLILMASCLRVWKTGANEIDDVPDVENTGYPPLRQTYCLSS